MIQNVTFLVMDHAATTGGGICGIAAYIFKSKVINIGDFDLRTDVML